MPCPIGKTIYRTRAEAEQPTGLLARFGLGKPHPAYRCPLCHGWHREGAA